MKQAQRIVYFRDLGPDRLKTLHRQTTRRLYRAKETIFVEGEPSPGLFWVERGRVLILHVSEDGREHILHPVEPGETFADVAALDGGPLPAAARAAVPSVVACLPTAALHRLIMESPTAALAAIQKLCSRLRHVTHQTTDLVFCPVVGRVARVLLRCTSPEVMNEVWLTQEELAAMTGTVRQVVARVLRMMENSGAVRRCHRRVQVIDREVLSRFTAG